MKHNTYQKIFIIQWSAMGDCILASTTFNDIKKQFPNAVIDLNVMPPWDKLFLHDPRFHNIINFQIRKQGFKTTHKWLKLLKKEKYDLIIDLQNSDRTKMLLTIARLFRFTKADIIGRSNYFYYHNSLKKEDISNNHVVDRYYEALRSIGVKQTQVQPTIYHDPLLVEKVTQKKQSLLKSNKFAVFVPGCSPQHPEKRWSSKNFIDLAQLLYKEDIDQIIILGAEGEADICNEIAASDARFINLCSQTELLEIPIWLANAEVVIANDTGIAHFAAVTNANIITLFGPTNPVQSKPYSHKSYILEAKNFGISDNINQIKPVNVLKTFQNITNKGNKTV